MRNGGTRNYGSAQRRRTRAILNRAFLCAPDGMPTVWIGRLLGHRNMGRVYGPDYMLPLCKLIGRPGYRHFFMEEVRELHRNRRRRSKDFRDQYCRNLHAAVPPAQHQRSNRNSSRQLAKAGPTFSG